MPFLLFILALTTIALIAQQMWRLFHGHALLKRAVRRATTPQVHHTGMAMVPVSESSVSKEPQSAKSSEPAVDPSLIGTEGMLEVQFDDEGELDMGTMERMLDILYKRPKEMKGYEAIPGENENEYRFRKKNTNEEQIHTEL